MKTLWALIGVMVASVAMAAVDVEGMWCGSGKKDCVPMCLTKDGRGQLYGYIGYHPVLWNTMSNGMIRIINSDYRGHLIELVFKYDSGKDVLIRQSDSNIDLCTGEKKVNSEKVEYSKVKLEGEEGEAYKKKALEDVEELFKNLTMANEREKKSAESTPPVIEKKEFVLKQDQKISELLSKLATGWSMTVFCGDDGACLEEDDGNYAITTFCGTYVLGNEADKDLICESGFEASRRVQSVPQSAKLKERGCSDKFMAALANVLKLQKSDMVQDVYCECHMYYSVFYKDVKIQCKGRKVEELVAGLIKSVRKVAAGDIKVKLSRVKPED